MAQIDLTAPVFMFLYISLSSSNLVQLPWALLPQSLCRATMEPQRPNMTTQTPGLSREEVSGDICRRHRCDLSYFSAGRGTPPAQQTGKPKRKLCLCPAGSSSRKEKICFCSSILDTTTHSPCEERIPWSTFAWCELWSVLAAYSNFLFL